MPYCTKRCWLAIKKPKKKSHKGENGKLLILAGSPLYHGALELAILAAVRFCDLIYVCTCKENRALIKKLKLLTPNIILLNKKTLPKFFPKMDAFLLGCGWEDNDENCILMENALNTKKPAVIDATALKMLNPDFLHKNCTLTPHAEEFKQLFSLPATAKSAKKMAKKFDCTILLKGPVDYIASKNKFIAVSGGNAGMTKGGTGDVLAGLCAALLAAGNPPHESAAAAAFLNKRAADELFKKMGAYYSSLDLASQLAFTAKKLSK
ncbi:NAD(P)H-hydrate dehydratase [Candidatus Micrarchaeota archaeon CG10_big_fil_rev_8_21_14_0_10_45_29]|nr:MAG: NAD(P)H-hydrate dehydratase [Candidatus Micrarchaeota archaeon CG10_big_fil_rev_8_21_14_0_10_45_29]QBM01547.1 bifunctional NAD(P)H-hydrate repair enzyme Nnr [uncultured archaeon]